MEAPRNLKRENGGWERGGGTKKKKKKKPKRRILLPELASGGTERRFASLLLPPAGGERRGSCGVSMGGVAARSSCPLRPKRRLLLLLGLCSWTAALRGKRAPGVRRRVKPLPAVACPASPASCRQVCGGSTALRARVCVCGGGVGRVPPVAPRARSSPRLPGGREGLAPGRPLGAPRARLGSVRRTLTAARAGTPLPAYPPKPNPPTPPREMTGALLQDSVSGVGLG